MIPVTSAVPPAAEVPLIPETETLLLLAAGLASLAVVAAVRRRGGG
jgi:hypothetical protein